MKLYLFASGENAISIRHFDSLLHALQHHQGVVDVFTNYDVPELALENVKVHVMTHDELLQNLQEQNECVFTAHSEVIFTLDAFTSTIAAHDHYAKHSSQVMIQMIAPNAIFQEAAPALVFYGGNRMWMTGTRLFTDHTCIPVAYGEARILANSILKVTGAPEFTDKIFHGGQTTLLTALPSLAFSTQFDLPVRIAASAFDAEKYMQDIPSYYTSSDDVSIVA